MPIGEIKTLVFSDGVVVTAPTPSTAQFVITDTTGWTGSQTTINYAISTAVPATMPDSRLAQWTLKDANYKQLIGPEIDCPDATHVRVTVDIALPVGTYYLVGNY